MRINVGAKDQIRVVLQRANTAPFPEFILRSMQRPETNAREGLSGLISLLEC